MTYYTLRWALLLKQRSDVQPFLYVHMKLICVSWMHFATRSIFNPDLWAYLFAIVDIVPLIPLQYLPEAKLSVVEAVII